jgi:hypothetical protein
VRRKREGKERGRCPPRVCHKREKERVKGEVERDGAIWWHACSCDKFLEGMGQCKRMGERKKRRGGVRDGVKERCWSKI